MAKHLSTERMEEWVQTDGGDWESFFRFLEKKAKVARKIQILENTGSGFKSPTEKKCSICDGDHQTNFCRRQKKPSLQLAVGESKMCHVCDQDVYTYKTKDGKSKPNSRIVNCPKFIEANKDRKLQILAEVKKKVRSICKNCSSYNHKSEEC